MLRAFEVAAGVGEWAVRQRHRTVVFLDPSLHLGEELVAETGCIVEPTVGVVVLRLEMSADVGIEEGWVSHHLLPVHVFQPGIRILSRIAVAGR